MTNLEKVTIQRRKYFAFLPKLSNLSIDLECDVTDHEYDLLNTLTLLTTLKFHRREVNLHQLSNLTNLQRLTIHGHMENSVDFSAFKKLTRLSLKQRIKHIQLPQGLKTLNMYVSDVKTTMAVVCNVESIEELSFFWPGVADPDPSVAQLSRLTNLRRLTFRNGYPKGTLY